MEKKLDKTQLTVKKGEGKTTEEKKLSYEELEKIAQQLSIQCQQLSARVQRQDMELTFKRLDYLFAVVNCTTNVFNNAFVTKCVKEIEDIMTPETEEPKE